DRVGAEDEGKPYLRHGIGGDERAAEGEPESSSFGADAEPGSPQSGHDEQANPGQGREGYDGSSAACRRIPQCEAVLAGQADQNPQLHNAEHIVDYGSADDGGSLRRVQPTEVRQDSGTDADRGGSQQAADQQRSRVAQAGCESDEDGGHGSQPER